MAAAAENGGLGAKAGGRDYEPEADDVHRVHLPQSSGIADEVADAVAPLKALLVPEDDLLEDYRGKSFGHQIFVFLASVFPILRWLPAYDYKQYLFGDIVAGLTISSLAVPQASPHLLHLPDLGYAKLAHLPPVNGLYSSFTTPLIYAAMGSSRHIAIGPVAVVSLLLGTLLNNEYDYTDTSLTSLYYDLAITSTFFAGVIQAAMAIFRLGFVIDFLSHAAVVGFMAGAAITIGLQQLKGLLGYTKKGSFTNKTNIVSVLQSVIDNTDAFNWRTFLIGISFLIYLITLRILSKVTKSRFFFFWNALGPLTSVIIATACVYGTRADKHGVAIVGHIKRGLNPSSIHNIKFSDPILSKGIKIGIVAGLIALCEATAIARTFAALKGYHISGNQEMLALGTMNIAGSLTSCYVSTGSFSRSAVNFAAGGNSSVTNLIMSLVLLLTLTCLTTLFKYLPNAVISAIIISAVIGLIDIKGAYLIWKTHKLDFVVLLGAFFGVVFISVEIGLLIAVSISVITVLVQVTRPHTAILGRIPGTTIYRSINQYPEATLAPGILAIRIDATIYFANAQYLRERIQQLVEQAMKKGAPVQYVIVDLTPAQEIDTTGVHAFEELHTHLKRNGVQLALSNPSKSVTRILVNSGFIAELGEEWLFLSVHEGVKVCGMLNTSKSDKV
eukprot:SM000169S02704  [mRNA]  locus=s169:77049:81972:- [translate_table: standard]